MNIEIRQYKDDDLEDLLIVWEKASRIAHPFMDDAFFYQERHNIPNLYLPNADTWVACSNHKVIGFIALIGSEVGGFFVDPDHHGKGAGKMLMDKAQDLHADLVLDVFKENGVGRRFYDRYGFEFQEEKVWEPTGDLLLRLAFSPAQRKLR